MKNFANAKFLILYIFNFCKNNPGVVFKKYRHEFTDRLAGCNFHRVIAEY